MKDLFLKKFGLLVKNAREKKGISQEQLGNAVDMHKNYIGMIERGERNVSFYKAMHLIQYLNMNIADLYDESSLKDSWQ